MGKKGVYNWKYEVGQRIIDKYKDITIIERKIFKTTQKYKIRCNRCGFDCNREYVQLYNNAKRRINNNYWICGYILTSIYECPCCGSHIKLVAPGINDISTTDPWIIPYFQGGYYEARLYHRTSTEKVVLQCPNCKEIIKDIRLSDFIKRKYFCHNCGKGGYYPNRLMFNILKQLGYDFEPEYSPCWIGNKRYDFYIPLLNLIIEMDGNLGHGNDVYNKSKTTIEDTIKIDNYKDKQANLHGIKVIRIDCKKSEFDYIYKNIVNSELNNILKLNDIDWNKVRIDSLTSNMIKACELYSAGQIDLKIIASEIGMKLSSVRKYLREGTELGLCKYDNNKLRKLRAHANSGSYKSRKIVCLNTNEIFETTVQAESKYNAKNISTCCNGKRCYSGIDPITHLPLVWVYYEDYLKMTPEDVSNKLEVNITRGRSIPIVCLQTKEIFKSFAEAAREYGLKTPNRIKECCEGRCEYYGTLENGTKLQWIYHKNYLKFNI